MRTLALALLVAAGLAACDRPVASPPTASTPSGRSLAEVLRSPPRAPGVALGRADLEAQAASATRDEDPCADNLLGLAAECIPAVFVAGSGPRVTSVEDAPLRSSPSPRHPGASTPIPDQLVCARVLAPTSDAPSPSPSTI
jgi:hypothetical protein